MKCLVVVRSLHFAYAAILARVAGFGKNVVALWRFWMRIAGIGNRAELVHGFRENRRLHNGRKLGGGCFHKIRRQSV